MSATVQTDGAVSTFVNLEGEVGWYMWPVAVVCDAVV